LIVPRGKIGNRWSLPRVLVPFFCFAPAAQLMSPPDCRIFFFFPGNFTRHSQAYSHIFLPGEGSCLKLRPLAIGMNSPKVSEFPPLPHFRLNTGAQTFPLGMSGMFFCASQVPPPPEILSWHDFSFLPFMTPEFLPASLIQLLLVFLVWGWPMISVFWNFFMVLILVDFFFSVCQHWLEYFLHGVMPLGGSRPHPPTLPPCK